MKTNDFISRLQGLNRRAVGLCWLKLPQFVDSGVMFSRRVYGTALNNPNSSLAWTADEAIEYFCSMQDFFDSDAYCPALCPKFKVALAFDGPVLHLANVVWDLDSLEQAESSSFGPEYGYQFALTDIERKAQRLELVNSFSADGYTLEETAEELFRASVLVAEEFVAEKLSELSSLEDATPDLVRRMEMSLESAMGNRDEVLSIHDCYHTDWYLTPIEAAQIITVLKAKYGCRVSLGSAVEMVEEAKRVGATDIAKLAALQSFDDDFKSIPKTRFRMSAKEVAGLSRYLGGPIMSQNKVRCYNDHLYLEVCRDIIREELDREYPHNTDHASVLQVGATMTDYKRWSSHEGHQFFFALKDDKDVPRVYSELLGKLGKKFTDMSLPSLTSKKGNTTALRVDGVSEMSKLLDKGNRQKIFLSKEDIPSRSHDVLFFPDCLYDMTLADFQWYWMHTDAKTGEAIIFFPDALLGEATQESDIYRYEEYFPTVENVEDILEQVWPSVLLLTPALPLKGFAEGADHLLRYCLSKGYETFKLWLSSLKNDDYPVELAIGSAFDLTKLGPIYRHLLRQLKPVFRKHLARARVTWRSGYQNGYNHRVKTWRQWLVERRFPMPDGTFVDVEVRARIGEMCHLRFWRSSGSSPITYSLEVPMERATVMVADIAGSYNLGATGLFGLDRLNYIPVNCADWYKLHNWAMAEPPDTLSFGVLMTTLNRIRGGLSLGSNVLVDPMLLQDKDVAIVALACYMETMRRSELLSAIEQDEKLKHSYESNMKKVGKITGAVLASIISGGLAIPLWFLAKWLVTTHPKIEFVSYPAPPKMITIPAKRRRVTPRQILEKPSTLVLPHKQIHTNLSCYLCQMQQSGAFSTTGRVEDGQWVVCSNSQCTGDVDVSMDTSQITDMIGQCRLAEEQHTAMGAVKLTPNIQKFKHWLETNVGGLTHSLKVSHVTGGPGTGKTEVIKALMHSYEKQGMSTGVLVPFSQLQTDYIETSVVGEPKKVTFDAQTTWYGTKWGKLDVMFVDECSAVRWDLIKAFAIHAGTKLVYLVGDRLQTGLNAKQGEGINPLDEQSGLDLSKIPTHELVKNFRLDAWRVKQKNRKYGYKMLAVRHDSLPPKFISMEDYKAALAKGNISIKREFVFSHESAKWIFGKESVPGDREKDNMSVRSSQGLTIKGDVAVSASEIDSSVIDAHGMINVADSRCTGQVWFVYHSSESDPVVDKLKELLSCSNRELIDDVWKDPWPTIEKPLPEYELTEPERKMDLYVQGKQLAGKVEVFEDSDDSDDTLVNQLVEPKITMKLGFEGQTPEDFGLYHFYRSVFHCCFVDALEESGLMNHVVRKSMLTLLGSVYADDKLMGRKGQGIFSKFESTFTTREVGLKGDGNALPVVDGKRYLPLADLCNAAELANVPVIVFKDAFPIYVSKMWRAGTGAKPLVLEISLNHVELRKIRRISCNIDMLEEEQLLSEITVCQHGAILAEIVKVKDIIPESSINQGVNRTDFKGKKPLVKFTDASDATWVVGRKPTFTRLELPELERKHHNLATNYCPPSSSWKEVVDPDENVIFRKTKLRLGTDAYRLASLVDPSGASDSSMLNEVGPVAGFKEKTNVKLNWEGFIFDRTKAGKLKRRESKAYRSFLPGMGNHYNNSPVESLIASQRVGRRERKAVLSAEAKFYADQVVEKTFREGWLKRYIPNRERCNAKIEEAIRALKSRNYHGRADSELSKTWEPRLTCANKDQFKPIKNHKLDLMKGGQVLLQSPPTVNEQYIAWMRVQAMIFKDRMQDDVFTDDYESPAAFRTRFNRAVKELPKGSQVAIVDGERWDSQQNEVTRYMEMRFHSLLGAVDTTIKEYFQVRGNLKFVMFGIFQGVTNGEKGSGFLDTKLGNTMLQAMVSNQVITGCGPKVVGIKGDDYIRIQTAVREDPHEVVKVKRLLGMKLNIDVGLGGEFCGNSVSRAGMYPSITRACIKAIAAKAKDYKMFTEHQQAYRDKIKEYQDVGLEECITFSAFAEKVSRAYVEACLAILNSLAHINRVQWEASTKKRVNPTFFLNDAHGPVLV